VSRLTPRARAKLWRVAAPWIDRGFRPRLRQEAGAPALLLSPHLDDAVIDCWSVLTGEAEVQVVNLCARPPGPGELTFWDRICGAEDSEALFRTRIDEDREALALAGHEALNLPFLEAQYREGRRPPSLREIDAALVRIVPTASAVYAPAALGTVHPDHALLRSYAVALARSGLPARLYADLPYCVDYGWPAWVTGDEAIPHLDVEAHWDGSQRGRALVSRDSAEVVRLTEDEATAKLAAMKTYRTQFPALDGGLVGRLSNPAIHRFEVFWPLQPA
jgi:LmbE family N-acetylglucosaminyl deacetylase